MPGDTTESREPAVDWVDEAQATLRDSQEIDYPNDESLHPPRLIAFAQVQATLAVAEELRALREALPTAIANAIHEGRGRAI